MLAMRHLVRPARLLDGLFRLAALLAWVGQLAVLGAPLVEAGAGTNAAPHVESHGNPLHHAHTPELCPACAALALVGRPEWARSPLVEPTAVAERPADAPAIGVSRSISDAARPRAPPMWKSEPDSFERFDSDSHTTNIHAFCTLAVRARDGRHGQCVRAAA
jgi:hypothetical protein